MEDYPRTILELEKRFATEEACWAYLIKLRWPDGFICPRCSAAGNWTATRGRLICRACRDQGSGTAGGLLLGGVVGVDDTYWGAEEEGLVGRLTEDKAIIIVAAEENGTGIGRIRLRHIPDLTKACLHGFIADAIEPDSTVRTDGLNP